MDLEIILKTINNHISFLLKADLDNYFCKNKNKKNKNNVKR